MAVFFIFTQNLCLPIAQFLKSNFIATSSKEQVTKIIYIYIYIYIKYSTPRQQNGAWFGKRLWGLKLIHTLVISTVSKE